MRHHLLLLALLSFLLIFQTSSSAQFSLPLFIDTLPTATVSQIASADFNQDGKEDLLTSNLNWPHDFMALYFNQGNEEFDFQSIPVADSLTNLESFAVGDINKDDRMDFMVATEFPSRLVWFENTLNGFIPHLLADSLDYTTQVLLADFDQNGWLDVLALQHVEIVVYLAISDGLFRPGQVIHSGTEFYAIHANDFNADSILDVAVASDGFEILLNDGTGHFTLHSAAGLALTFGLQSADLDADYDMDIAAYMALQGILFFENDGQGQFTFRESILESGDTFLEYVLQDLNCDHTIDLYTSIPQLGKMVLVVNAGQGEFTHLDEIHTQSGELVAAVTTGDINGDSIPDVIWGNRTLGLNLNECEYVSVSPSYDRSLAIEIYPNPTSSTTALFNPNDFELRYALVDATGRTIERNQKLLAHTSAACALPYPGLFVITFTNEMGDFITNEILIRL